MKDLNYRKQNCQLKIWQINFCLSINKLAGIVFRALEHCLLTPEKRVQCTNQMLCKLVTTESLTVRTGFVLQCKFRAE